MARNESITCSMVVAASLLFLHRLADVEPTNITAWDVPSGMVATIRARRGISVWVLCDKVEKTKSIIL